MNSSLLQRLRDRLGNVSGLHLCVAYSGGMDSTVLLHLLARIAPEAGFSLSALHVHHGLSVHADQWSAHCQAVCDALGVRLRIERVAVARDAGKGLEAAARDVRHAVLASEEADWIMLAHHADDQAETLLHRLLRGTGVAGAAAMREQDATRRLWRPLLQESRSELQAWAHAEALLWVEDESNLDEALTRNYLRRSVLSPLKARFPSAVDTLCRATRHFAEAAGLLEEVAAEDAATVAAGALGARGRLRALSVPRIRNLLRYWIQQAGEMSPVTSHLDALLEGLLAAGPVRWVQGDLAVCAYQDRVWFELPSSPAPRPVVWRGETVLPWGGGVLRFVPVASGRGLYLNPADEVAEFRVRIGGEQVRPASGRPRRTIKTLCQDAGIPPWWRDTLPLLWVGDAVLWVGGVGMMDVSHRPPPKPGQIAWQIDWETPQRRF